MAAATVIHMEEGLLHMGEGRHRHMVAEEEEDSAEVLARCTRQYAPSAARTAKCRSSQLKEGLSIVGIASRSSADHDTD